MTDQTEHEDPAPLEHADAERVTEEQADRVPTSEDVGGGSLEDDPARNPPEGPLRDVKGG